MKITNWGLRGKVVGIYYIVKEGSHLDEDAEVSRLHALLQPAIKDRKIKLIKLNCEPEYKTTSGPGSKIARDTDVPGVMA